MRITINKDTIVKSSGLIKRTVINIPISSVTTVYLSQNILNRITGTSRISIETTANMSVANQEAKIRMVFKSKECEHIYLIISEHGGNINGANIAAREQESITSESQNYALSEILLSGLFHFRVLRNLFAYYGFRLENRSDSIYITQGLISRKSFAFLKSGITGFEFRQNILEKFAGVGTLRVFATGIGNDIENDDSYSVISPIIKEDAVIEYLSKITPEFHEEFEKSFAAPRSLHYYFYRPSIFITGLGFIVALIYSLAFQNPRPLFWVALPIFALAIISRVLEHSNTALGISPDILLLQSGGFTKMTNYVKIDQAESITKKASIFKRKRGITSVSLDFLGDQLITHAELHNILIADADRIADKLTY